MVVLLLLGFGLLSGFNASLAKADFTFGEPVNIQSDFPFLTATDWIFCFSPDELEVYLCIFNRPGGYGQYDIWVSKRSSVEDKWGAPENLGPLVNSESWDRYPFLSPDGLELYFQSDRPGGYGDFDLYVTRRATRTSPWEAATNLGPKVNSASADSCSFGVAGWAGTLFPLGPSRRLWRFGFLRQQAGEQERSLGRRGQCRPGGE